MSLNFAVLKTFTSFPEKIWTFTLSPKPDEPKQTDLAKVFTYSIRLFYDTSHLLISHITQNNKVLLIQ